MPPKKRRITNSIIQSSSPMARFLSSSSSVLSTSSSLLDLTSSTSSPSPPTTSALASQRDGGKTSYIWNHGKKFVHEGHDRWQCNHCERSYAMSGKATTNQRDHLNSEHGIPDPKAPSDTKQFTLDNYRRPPIRFDVLRKLIVEWIVERRHSFNEIESQSLH